MKRVAIFGGSFSPVHSGHITLARGILDRDMADEVWLMPCRLNPLKAGTRPMDDESRIALIEKALEYCRLQGEERIRLCLTELSMPSPSYTADTMRRLKNENPELRFRLAVGADSYLSFEKWKEWEWLQHEFNPIVYPRPGYPINNLKPCWTLLSGADEVNISSSAIREALKQGEKIPEAIMPWGKP